MTERYYKKQSVEIRQSRGGVESWKLARIIQVSGRGAEIRFDDESANHRTHHVLYRDMRLVPPKKALLPPHRIGTPVLTAQEIDRLNRAKEPDTVITTKPTLPVLALVPSAEIAACEMPLKIEAKTCSPRQRIMTPIGAYLRNARTARGLSQNQVAKTLGCHNQYVSKWEIGDWRPSDDILIAYAEQFALDIGEFDQSARQFHIRKNGQDSQGNSARSICPACRNSDNRIEITSNTKVV